ncbi:hypothetical protein K469DRAFT_708273 [Zopfia rhizophila CBS 207.26]|uniref:5-Methylcytosine G/T mismatch-specific DNA glycosylase n=1 Tax=Zopfia rhizophila CBS 207.26 TaxID=1314779 RepID=A0A6A6E1C8_9PEZI|nr:hypothetical protein K469DRAFT_708273 [Zopfia rhizophila CBS 207.26]
MLGSSEARRRKKDPDRDRDSPRSKDKDKDRERHKSSKSSRSSRKTSSSTSKDDDGERERRRERSSREHTKTPSSHTSKSTRKMAVVPEMERRPSLGSVNNSRTSLPYPTFSKTHSKENIYTRENVERRKSPFTPEPTDPGEDSQGKEKESEARNRVQSPARGAAPPSPPLTATTAVGADLRKTASANSMRRKNSEVLHKEMEGGRRSVDSGTRLTPEPRSAASRSSIREDGIGAEGTDLTSTTGSQPSTVRQRDKSPHLAPPKTRTDSPSNTRPPGSTSRTSSRQASEITQSTDSDATSVAPDHHNARRKSAESPTNSEASPASVVDSSPRTPTQLSEFPSVVSAQKDRPPTVEILDDPTSRPQSIDPDYADSPLTPPPPPPPPAMMEAPRVDYLLQNGGLSRPVPRSLVAAVDGGPITAYSQYTSPRMDGPQIHDVRKVFAPIQNLLDDYSAVMLSNGSLAVATGYRSVARRLLDRLEAVFARNISSEYCQCIMCLGKPIAPNHEEANGVNWGEILELVSGRCDLPNWPPFDQATASGLGISDLEAPCQRIDVDVPEQFREHYTQQSRKTKVAVQSWLSSQQDSAPEEADDETLTFAMLTRLEPDKRPLFYALLYGMKQLPTPRSQPASNNGTPPIISKAALALQRLYRLYTPPRDQLVVMYLIKHPDMHSILATLAAVTKHEWEILVSGRFDGFLWSGAEDIPNLSSPPPSGPSRGPSRGPMAESPELPRRFASPFSQAPFTPFSPGPSPVSGSRSASTRPGSTRPGTTGPAPVQMDEETEIAVLAEIEREIYLCMEAMEDAFEHLHNSAEVVRRRLRERGAALSMVAQARRGSMGGGIEVRTDTPASYRPDLDGESLEDLRSEILPDDSASNVSFNRRGHKHRRARRTPAPVEEESEEEVGPGERIKKRY